MATGQQNRIESLKPQIYGNVIYDIDRRSTADQWEKQELL